MRPGSLVEGSSGERRERAAAAVGVMALAGVFLIGLVKGEPYPTLTALLGIGLTAAPVVVRKHYCLPLPWALTALTAVVTFLHAFGILVRAYDLVWWWDMVTHLLATAVLALATNLVVLVAGKRYPAVALPPRYVPLAALGLVIALGVAWEVLEFAFDGLLGMNMQYSLNDTAVDLSIDILGAVFVASLIPPYMAQLDEDYGLCKGLTPRR